VCTFPGIFAVPLPDAGTILGRSWLEEHGVSDTEVSTRHLAIDRRGGALRVADEASRNGTWINGARLTPHELVALDDGDVLRIGRTLFVYRPALSGGFDPSPPVGSLVGPFGLRAATSEIAGFSKGQGRTVLVEGETGVGKELVAHALASALGREKPFAAVNIASLARGVFESQLFGHVAGAFSDARSASPGIVVAHDRGTLFLDEIGELDLGLQAKLLRLIENREVLPVGASRSTSVDILLIAATNRNLEEMALSGTFRRDLLARLAMARVHVPALRERPEDIPSVALALTARAGETLAVEHIEVEAMERLLLERWPNNVRQLEATLTAARRVDPEPGLRRWAIDKVLGPVASPKSALTKDALDLALRATDGNVSAAASSLGVSRGKVLRLRKRSPAK
jgi:DNA-binding NtrC family response regulator